ncbi:YheC/YheD family endospore coat-associated protein [Cohnella sp. 56]|uniref:YheC/YheD family endospore coat-associated protein n=1 Tax=Cohnella sp. 56 TaxID=3113722 RepID=UPI0030E797AA
MLRKAAADPALLARAPTDAIVQAQERPVLAILTIDDDLQLFRGNRQNFADLLKTGEDQGFLAYVATVRHLKLDAPRVQGFTYNAAKDVWIKSWFPRPTIVYNRIPQREDERLPWVRKKLARIASQPDMALFNRRFFNKWSLFKWLSAYKSTRGYVPETKRLTEQRVLSGMLKRHPLVYLKPVRGKAGVGIMTVKLSPEKNLPYRLQVQDEKGSSTYHCATIGRLWTRVRANAPSESEPYIAQRGIPLAKVNGRPFDLRALVQKNAEGVWELTGIGARMAGMSSITTHVPRGGSIEDPERLLVAVFGQEKAQQVFANARHAVLTLASRIERASRSRMFEMSMDLGVDEQGNLWFFEANSKPMKFDEPHIRKKSLERIFQYGHYLHRRRQQERR